MSIPDVSKLQRMIVQSYEPDGSNVDEWELYKNTPTLKFYVSGRSIVIAIRGTADSEDVKADALIALGSLEKSNRWKKDLAIIQQAISEFNPEHIYAVGHSLGGALLDLLLHKNIVEKGVSYNPAVQPQDILRNLPNRRIYMSDDPLYLLIGRFLRQKPEVRPSKAGWFQTLARISPAGNILTAKGYLDAHKLDSFKGGKKCGSPPYHDYSKGKASVFVLTCIDPRYTYDVAYYLQHKKELHQDYDLFTLAGASVGAEKKEWRKVFFDNLELGIKLHGITEIWCFDHLDCGMYKATFGLKKDLNPKIHKQCMDKLKKLVHKKHPELKFREFLVDAHGHINVL